MNFKKIADTSFKDVRSFRKTLSINFCLLMVLKYKSQLLHLPIAARFQINTE